MRRVLPGILISLLVLLSASLGLANQLPFNPGETITYDIKKLKMDMGDASLIFKGEVEVAGQKAFLIIFTAKALNFFDEEKIYVDAKTFLPIMVERNLNLWGKKEIITEKYDHQKDVINITKKARDKTSEMVLNRPGPIENIYGFIYRYRAAGQNKQGERFKLHLPTRDVEFHLVGEEKVKAANQEFTAYYMESVPKKNRVWFDKSSGKIPLKIDGAVNLGAASLIMKEYKKE